MSLPDSAITNSPIGNLAAMVNLLKANTVGRCAWVGIWNSNGQYEDNGAMRGLDQVLSSQLPMVDFGVMSPNQSVTTDFGGLFMRRRSGGVGANGTKTLDTARSVVSFSGTYVHVTRTITSANFTSFAPVANSSYANGMAGTGISTSGPVLIASGTATTIVLAGAGLGAGADGQTITGLAIRPPQWLYEMLNLPTTEFAPWLPHAEGLYYLSSGTDFATGVGDFMMLKRQCPISVNGRMKYHMLLAKFASGTSSVVFGAYYYNWPAGTFPGGSSSISSNSSGTIGNAADGTLAWLADTGMNSFLNRTTPASVPGDTGNDAARTGANAITYGPGITGTNTGPLAFIYSHLSMTDRPYGFSIQHYMSRGGMTRGRMANLILNQLTDTAHETYLRAVCHQFTATAGGDGTGTVAFLICDAFNTWGAGNDVDGINKNTTSIGPNPAAGNTGAGFADNARAMETELTARLAAAATAEGVSVTPYFIRINEYCVADSPPTGTPADYATDAKVERWKQIGAAADVAYAITTSNVIHWDLAKLATCQELINGCHIAMDGAAIAAPDTSSPSTASTDNRHMSPSGYDILFGRLFSAARYAQSLDAATGGTGITASVGGVLGATRGRLF